MAADSARAEAARAFEAARAEKLAARDREEKSLTSQEREEEKALENVFALLLDIKKQRDAERGSSWRPMTRDCSRICAATCRRYACACARAHVHMFA